MSKKEDKDSLSEVIENNETSSNQEDHQTEDLQSEIQELKDQLNKALAESAEAKDTLLRKAADLENTRKRLQADKEKSVKLANKGLLSDLLEVLDNFNRAFEATTEDTTAASLMEGVKMIETQLLTLLANKYDVKPFDSVGEVFNPERHEAIALGEAAEGDEQIVLNEYQKGYTWGETILRTAKTVVSAPAS